MFKNIIGPVQAWLLSQGKCVGCGKVLPKKKGQGTVKVMCECKRVYMYDEESGTFRRATFDEIK
jgi:phage FluMu protein Com